MIIKRHQDDSDVGIILQEFQSSHRKNTSTAVTNSLESNEKKNLSKEISYKKEPNGNYRTENY